MEVLKICKSCNEKRVFTDPIEMMETTHHNASCPFLQKIIKDQWWKFWIRESFDYVNCEEK